MVDEQPQRATGHDLRKQHLDVRIGTGESLLDLLLEWGHRLLRQTKNSIKKAGERPLSVLPPGGSGAKAVFSG
jgi:hypothetical protein